MHKDEVASREQKSERKALPKSASKGDPLVSEELYSALRTKKPLPVITALLNRDPVIDGVGPFNIPLVAAAEGCESEAARQLLARGADPNAPYTKGMALKLNQPTALMQAAANGCVDVAAVLLEHGAKPNVTTGQPALVEAVVHKSEPMVRYLLDHGADPNLESPLGAAAFGCNDAMVTLLLDRKAQVEGADSRGRTPLMEAALAGCPSVIRTLLAKGARANQGDASGKTAICHLLEGHHSESDNQGAVLNIALDLIKAGANPNLSPRGAGVTPLMLAAEKDMSALFRLLLENGADPKAVDGQGRTAIMHAVMNDNADAVERLLARGAAANIRDRKGMTALDYTKERPDSSKMRRIVASLRNAGAVE
jgi:ankyrin repeat protein